MGKRLTTGERIRRYMEAHPNATPKKIAEALGVKASYVHVLRSTDKKRLAEGKPIRRIKHVFTKKIELIPPKEAKPKLAFDSLPQVGDTVGGLTLTRKEQDGGFAYTWVRQAEEVKPEPELPITMEEPKADPVNHPAHYKVGGIETIDFIEAKKLGYNLGNVVKYITRADHKGNRKQDLAKALWYLKREIEATQGE
jgi:hypothetical protein